MSDDGWRTSVRWVVAHPTEAKVLLAGRDGASAAGASWLPPDLERLRDFSLLPRPA